MSVTKRIAFSAAASWLSRGANIVMGLLLMPMLFRHLPKGELGVWLLLGQSWAAMGILDLGFSATLTRRIAFAVGLSDAGAPLNDDTLKAIADLVTTGRLVYRTLAVFAFSFSFVAGFIYLRHQNLNGVEPSHAWIAWGIICLSQAINMWASVWNDLLSGVGYIGWDAILNSIANSLALLGQILVVELGGGLIALASVATAGIIIQRFLTLGFARRMRPELFSLTGKWSFALVREMVSPALRSWITALGGALVLSTDQFLIVGFKDVAAVPCYRAAFVIVHNINILAMTLPLASQVFISHLWQQGNIKSVHLILKRNSRVGWLIMLAGSACLLVIGKPLFEWWLGPGNFIGYAVLGAFLMSETMEVQSYIIASSSRATEDEAFAISAVTGGLAKLGMSWLLAHWLGLFGIALGTVIGLLFTNQWYMTLRGLWRLKIPFRDYVHSVLIPCAISFPLMFGPLFGLRYLILGVAPLVQIAIVGSACGGLFCIFAWFLVLEPDQRLRARQAMRFNLFAHKPLLP